MKVLIAGGGGINSWLVAELDRLRRYAQIGHNIHFTIYDPDTVEKKNLAYQNFDEIDLLANKAESLGDRYIMTYQNVAITDPKQFDAFDIIISGVDNSKFRRMLFEYVDKHPKKYWIDLRAEGNQIAFYTRHPKNTLETLLATLPSAEEDEKSTSCQRSWELSTGIVQMGNKIVAMIGVQLFLNHIRGEANPPGYTRMF